MSQIVISLEVNPGSFWAIAITLVVAMLPVGAVALTATTATLVSSPNPSTFGQAVTLAATVSPAAATGKVTFYDGVTVLGIGALSGGQATLTTALLPSGSRSLKAYYGGDATYAASASATVAQTVVALPQNGFQAAVNYNAGTFPQSVAVGDFNGDGKADLAVANTGSSNVSVLLGNGNGTFQAAVNYNAGSGPQSVAVGDFNGDGKADLAVANNGSSNVSVLLGNGDGTFQAAVNYNTGSGPLSVAVGDFNGDGKADLAVANLSSASVSVLLGKGDGTFQTAVNYFVGSDPFSVTVGDFNGDGKADLAVGYGASNNVSVLLGNGVGSFQAAVNYNVGTNPYSVAAGDFNADGKADLAVANVNSNNVSILLGAAGVVSLSSISINFGNQAVGVSSAARSVTVTNTGTIALTVTNIATSGDFSQTNNCATVAVSGSCTITVTFTPATSGSRTGAITITDNASSSPQLVRLFGAGTSGPVGAKVRLSNVGLNFGAQALSTASAAKTVTLTNNGDTTLMVTSISAGGDFAQSNTCSSVAVSSNCTISVTFTPTLAGARLGVITIVDSAAGSPHVIRLFGTGSGTTPAISFSTVSVNFGNQTNGVASAAKAVTVTNTGDSHSDHHCRHSFGRLLRFGLRDLPRASRHLHPQHHLHANGHGPPPRKRHVDRQCFRQSTGDSPVRQRNVTSARRSCSFCVICVIWEETLRDEEDKPERGAERGT